MYKSDGSLTVALNYIVDWVVSVSGIVRVELILALKETLNWP